MGPSDKEFGELIGEVRGLREAVDDMRTENAQDHANVMREITGLREDVAKKADTTRVDTQDVKIGELKEGLAERKGQMVILAVLGGGAVTLVVGLLLQASGGGG